jgi:hypothetical protein
MELGVRADRRGERGREKEEKKKRRKKKKEEEEMKGRRSPRGSSIG